MNLHAIAAPAIGVVNPFVPVTVNVSIGSTQTDDGTRVPTYDPIPGVLAQIQALTFRDIQQISALNLQGTRRAIYFYGEFDGIVRPLLKGGDLVVFPDGSTWLIAMQLEQWVGWCKVVATLQNGS